MSNFIVPGMLAVLTVSSGTAFGFMIVDMVKRDRLYSSPSSFEGENSVIYQKHSAFLRDIAPKEK